MKLAVAIAVVAFLLEPLNSSAQEPVAEAVKEAVKPALLSMVKEGVFELQHGKSIDLTDRKILLSFPKAQDYLDRDTGQFRDGHFTITINGDQEIVQGGRRFDLKKFETTSKFVSDTDVCTLDAVELVEAKGTAARAVMRLNSQ